MYIVLTGPPGIGKSTILSQIERMLRALPEHKIAPSSVTTASLIDSLFDASRKIVRPAATPPYVEFNYLIAIASELGVLLPVYDFSFMNALTKIYDGEFYEERRRGNKLHITIKHPLLSIIGGTTPSYLNAFLPEGAWDQGFTSRTIFVYSGEQSISHIFDDERQHEYYEGVYRDLIHDLKIIGNYFGLLTWDPDAIDAITAWHMSGGRPVPEHGKLLHYTSRRTAHLLKLCIVAAVNRSDFDYIITLPDYQIALDWLLEVELYMPDIFRSMVSGGDSRAIEDAFQMISVTYAKERKPVDEHRVIHFLRDRTPSHSIYRVIQVMVQAQHIQAVAGSAGRVAYIPMPRATHGL